MRTPERIAGKPRGPSFRLLILHALFWTTMGFVFALSRSGSGHSFRSELLPALIEWWLWGLATPLIVAVDRRLPAAGRFTGGNLIFHLLLGPFWIVAFSLCSESICWALGLRPWGHLFINLRQDLFWTMLIYLLIVGVYQTDRYRKEQSAAAIRIERMAKNLSEARLELLRAQLDPHFLFNALNTISAEVTSDPTLARNMIEHLGDLLRASLDLRDRQEVTLGEEMDLLQNYLSIQTARFGDRLRLEVSIPNHLRQTRVPTFFLQPLVENAIRHGLAPRAEGGTVRIAAEDTRSCLLVTVADDGVGLPADWDGVARSGLGLTLTAERLQVLYPGPDSLLTVSARKSGGTIVEVRLPFRRNSFVQEP